MMAQMVVKASLALDFSSSYLYSSMLIGRFEAHVDIVS